MHAFLYSIEVSNIWAYPLTKRCNVDANLDASDNVVSGSEPSLEMLTRQSKNRAKE